MSNIILPTAPIPPTSVNPKLLTLYGQMKIGKSTVCSKLPNHCFLVTDRNGQGNDHILSTRIPITDYDHFINVCDEIKKAGKPYKYLILDTASTFEDMCEEDATKQYRGSNAGKGFKGRSVLELVGPDYNPGYRWLRLSFQLAMQRLVAAADHCIVICHMAEKYMKVEAKDKGKSDTKASAAEIELAGKIRAKLCAASDAIGYVFRTSNQDGTQQEINIDFHTAEFVNCGANCPHLDQKKFKVNKTEDWNQIYLP